MASHQMLALICFNKIRFVNELRSFGLCNDTSCHGIWYRLGAVRKQAITWTKATTKYVFPETGISWPAASCALCVPQHYRVILIHVHSFAAKAY